MVAMIDKSAKWEDFARDCAMDAHENHFASRHGIWFFSDIGKTCVFNNCPHAGRDRELAELRRRLSLEGIAELAFAEYPSDDVGQASPAELSDTEAGYSFAMILDCREERREWLDRTLTEILVESVRRPTDIP